MIEGNNFKPFEKHSAWPFQNLNCMGRSLEQRQPECLSASVNLSANMIFVRSPVSGFTNAGVNPGGHMVPPNLVMPVSAWPVSDIPGWKIEQGFEFQGLLQNSFPSFPTFAPSAELYCEEKRTELLYRAKAMNDTFPGSLPKGFLIFDKSGSQTQLSCHAICPSAHYATAVTAKQASDPNLLEKQAVKEALLTAEQSSIPEESDEKQINVEESEMHEDSEELNALLYSDEEDDDILSTDHSPAIIRGNCHKVEQFEEIIEEFASSDRPNKQQKQLNGGYMKSSLMDSASSVNLKCSRKLDIDLESSHTSGQIQLEEMCNMSGKNRQKTDNIHMMLRALESIVPGAKGKDPFLVLDESINYLRSLKLEAKALGVYHF